VSSGYRGRFAPTPSGPLHFGSVVAAVGSWLDARSRRGEWHVRIDDLDPPRVIRGAADAILRCLEALALDWDGEIVYQSRRRAAYRAALERLKRLGLVYPCACSRSEIAQAGLSGPEGPIYPGTCRNGIADGRPMRALRLLTRGAQVAFDDRVLGIETRDLERSAGDFVLWRNDGVYAFHLASAVDDGELGMTEVVRGADLLESSLRQAHVIALLALPVPRYAHLPVATDARGEKLSKQTHAPQIDPAHTAPVLWSVLRFLGQAPPDAMKRAPATEILAWAKASWSLDRVPKQMSAPAPAGFASTAG
jgi:glutamyl-Q tRNA(Asp) synthetase